MTIVLCTKGYPGNYKKNLIIKNINEIKLTKDNMIFHAGTKFDGKNLISVGGRVLNFTSLGNNYLTIRKKLLN